MSRHYSVIIIFLYTFVGVLSAQQGIEEHKKDEQAIVQESVIIQESTHQENTHQENFAQENNNSDHAYYTPVDLSQDDIKNVPEQELQESQELAPEEQVDQDDQEDQEKQEEYKDPVQEQAYKKIRSIIIAGNAHIPDEAILHRLPYKIGEKFDPAKTAQLIRILYYDLKRFSSIKIHVEPIGQEPEVNLYITVQEKTPIKEVVFEGNKQISSTVLKEKTTIGDLPAIDEQELRIFAHQIQKQYREKNYHHTVVTPELSVDPVDGKAIAKFSIVEGSTSLVKRISFKGNTALRGKQLRAALFSHEDWILGALDGSGMYDPQRVEADKHMIEQLYQNNGYLMAKVTEADTDIDEKTGHVYITFTIKEGDKFTISSVQAPGNDLVEEERLLAHLPVHAGSIYSREAIVNSIKTLESIWGEYGHIFAHIEPSIQPDLENKTVALAFNSDLGEKVFLNKITIRGNKKTRDKIIRRRLLLREGEKITNRLMEESKSRVEGLGFFDQREGVNWKTTRLAPGSADLDLILKEIKTGNISLQCGIGGMAQDLTSPASGLSMQGNVTDSNLFGSGIRLTLNGQVSKSEYNVNFNLTQPWLFDKPIMGAFDLYHRRPTYDDLRGTAQSVSEVLTGFSNTIGFISPYIYNSQLLCKVGYDDLRYNAQATASLRGGDIEPHNRLRAAAEYQSLLNVLFNRGDYFSVAFNIDHNRLNHPIHPSRGHKHIITSQLAFPGQRGCSHESFKACELNNCVSKPMGFHKFFIDTNWFTPLIGEYDLVLRLHGFFGIVTPLNGRIIPYREMFHIGGPSSVRGFLFGQIGPRFLHDSIGATRAFYINTELVFPITSDFSMKGVLFYDGGAGWGNPYIGGVSPEFLRESVCFDYRHAVGFGVRLLKPVPATINWGFKLDPRKKLGETTQEVHFGGAYDF